MKLFFPGNITKEVNPTDCNVDPNNGEVSLCVNLSELERVKVKAALEEEIQKLSAGNSDKVTALNGFKAKIEASLP